MFVRKPFHLQTQRLYMLEETQSYIFAVVFTWFPTSLALQLPLAGCTCCIERRKYKVSHVSPRRRHQKIKKPLAIYSLLLQKNYSDFSLESQINWIIPTSEQWERVCPWPIIFRIAKSGNAKGGRITVPLTSCLTGLELAVRQLTIFVFYLQNRLNQTSQTGGQRYSDTSPFSILCMGPMI